MISTYVPRFMGTYLDLNKLGKAGPDGDAFPDWNLTFQEDAPGSWCQALPPGFDPLGDSRYSLTHCNQSRMDFDLTGARHG